MLNEQEVKKIKEQIINQIDSWTATQEQKEQAKQQILAMSTEQLEEFLVKNKLIKTPENKEQTKEKNECPFCLIIQGKLQAYKIDENKKSIALLEINPLSRGHALIISKQHEKLDSSAFTLANKTAKKLKTRLKPEQVKIENAEILGHQLINIIPVYKEQKLERKKAEESELKELQEKLTSKQKQKTEKIIKEKILKQLEKAPQRFP